MGHHRHLQRLQYTVWRYISPYGESEYAARVSTPRDAAEVDPTKQIIWQGLAYSGDEAEEEARHRQMKDRQKHTKGRFGVDHRLGG